MVDWGYKSIYRNLTKEQVSEIYESEEFWSSVKPNEILMKALEDSEEDSDQESYVSVENEETLMKVFNIFKDKFKDEFDFVDND